MDRRNQEIYTVEELIDAVWRKADAGYDYGEMVENISDYLGPEWMQEDDKKVTVSWPKFFRTKSISEFSYCQWADLGVIPSRWLERCMFSESRAEVEDWFADVHNARSAEIDKGRNVYVCFANRDGHWLSQEDIRETIERIEAGI